MNTPSKMPPDLQEVYDTLDGQLCCLNRHLRTFLELFGSGQDRVDLLNSTAGPFFGYLQNSLFELLVITASRMSDPAKSMGKDNHSFDTLRLRIPSGACAKLSTDVDHAVEDLRQQCNHIRTVRHKKVVHLDSAHNVQLNPLELAPVPLSDFRSIYNKGRDILNLVSVFFDGISVSHSIAPAPGDVGALLIALKNAEMLKAEDSFKYFMGFSRGHHSELPKEPAISED